MHSVFLPGRDIYIQVEMTFNFKVFSTEDTGCEESVSQIIRPSGRGKQQKQPLQKCCILPLANQWHTMVNLP